MRNGALSPLFRRPEIWLIALSLLLSSCSHAPSQNVLGSFFPAWMVCALGGILTSVVVRQCAAKAGIDGFIPMKLLVYSALSISATFLLWLLWFGN